MDSAAATRWLVTLFLLVLAGLVYPVIALAVATGLRSDETGINFPAALLVLGLPIVCSMATAAVFGRPWPTRLGMGLLSEVALIALGMVWLNALARSGLFE